jgi:hypothetical protein
MKRTPLKRKTPLKSKSAPKKKLLDIIKGDDPAIIDKFKEKGIVTKASTLKKPDIEVKKVGKHKHRIVANTKSGREFIESHPLLNKTVFRASTLSTKRKATGEKEVFRRIWEATDGSAKCLTCGVHISEGRAINFSHLLPKGKYPEYRLDKRNIVLQCGRCHMNWHNYGNEMREVKRWSTFFSKYDDLWEEVYPPNEPRNTDVKKSVAKQANKDGEKKEEVTP